MKSLIESTALGAGWAGAYPKGGYGPGEAYPEFEGRGVARGEEGNAAFAAVRAALAGLGLDRERYGTHDWNPFGALVKAGGRVLVKPNWVLHRNEGGHGMECMVTHPAVLAAVLEYVALAEPGAVVVGDAPLQGCDWGRLMEWAGLGEVLEAAGRRMPLAVKDFRRTVTEARGDGRKAVREGVRGLEEYVETDMGEDSFLEEISGDWRRFRVTMYDPRPMERHHRPGVHRFLLARDVFEADLVVNCPKLKTHKKAGLTCCLKNLIGINGNKEYLPHHRTGAAEGGRGDSRPEASRLADWLEAGLDFINRHRDWERAYRWAEKWIYRVEGHRPGRVPGAELEGNWHGNDTIWRTCLDLNRALLYGDAQGRLHAEPQREEVSVVDAVVAGQGEGPLRPEPLLVGAVFAARNPVAGDWLAARLLGFDARKIPMVARGAGGGGGGARRLPSRG
ncbi:MAG: DUF362 domain-containing protein, partial [Kiritimatiellae bacterium]|nr:DUF362 domain-containing protein [Kiritimatiellia bacterium]